MTKLAEKIGKIRQEREAENDRAEKEKRARAEKACNERLQQVQKLRWSHWLESQEPHESEANEKLWAQLSAFILETELKGRREATLDLVSADAGNRNPPHLRLGANWNGQLEAAVILTDACRWLKSQGITVTSTGYHHSCQHDDDPCCTCGGWKAHDPERLIRLYIVNGYWSPPDPHKVGIKFCW